MSVRVSLFEPGIIGGKTIKNRLVVAPMCQYRAREGFVQTWHKVHYGKLAGSGAGTVCIEATAVSAQARSTPYDLGLWDEAHAQSLAQLIEVMRDIEPSVCIKIQLFDAGRKGSCSAQEKRTLTQAEGGWSLRAPSAISYGGALAQPESMSEAVIEESLSNFERAAALAARAGVDAIELHASHGFLVHQFFSPLSNQRDDDWGGTKQKRQHYAEQAFLRIRRAAPNLIVGARISSDDWIEGGCSTNEAICLGLRLKALGSDYLDVTSGGLAQEQQIPRGIGYQMAAARKIRQVVGLPTLTAGLIRRPEQAESAINEGNADFVNVGRAFLMDPHWGWRAALVLGANPQWPEPYRRGMLL